MIDYKEKYLKYKFKYLKNKERQLILNKNKTKTNNIKGGGLQMYGIIGISIIVILAGLAYYYYTNNTIKYNEYMKKYQKYKKYEHFCKRYNCEDKSISKCYRINSIKYHPDKALNEEDKLERTKKMYLLNGRRDALQTIYEPNTECNKTMDELINHEINKQEDYENFDYYDFSEDNDDDENDDDDDDDDEEDEEDDDEKNDIDNNVGEQNKKNSSI